MVPAVLSVTVYNVVGGVDASHPTHHSTNTDIVVNVSGSAFSSLTPESKITIDGKELAVTASFLYRVYIVIQCYDSTKSFSSYTIPIPGTNYFYVDISLIMPGDVRYGCVCTITPYADFWIIDNGIPKIYTFTGTPVYNVMFS